MARELLPAGGLKCDCGYPLVGLPERRCPECGRAFSAEQFCLTEAALERAMRDCGAPAAGPRTDCKT